MFALHLYQRLAEGNEWERALTLYAQNNWRRTTRSRGGYWTADFSISGVSQYRLQDLYNTMIGKRVQEWSYGDVQWEGEIVELQLTLNGVTHITSLDSELWHNRVKCEYTYPRVDDIEQGNLTYNPIVRSFQDDAQDFSDWETLAGNAGWEITVTNNDATTAQAYLGASFNTLNPNDSILVYHNVDLSAAGWNGDVVAKVPISYEISDVLLAGEQQETAWTEQQESIDIYGTSEYIDVLADECYAAAAEASRDKRLNANAYPRSIPAGGLSSGQARSGGDRLDVACAGFVFGMNRRFYEQNTEPLDISDQIRTLVAASEFVTAGGILVNDTLQVPLTGADITNLIWDNIEGFIQMGDTSGTRYRGGVRSGQLFDYDLEETDVLYHWSDGRLEYANGQTVPPALIRPDILVRLDAPLVIAAPGSSNWSTTIQTYIQEVEFIAPNSYRLIPEDGDVLEGSL